MNRLKEILVEKIVKQIWLAEMLGKSFNTVNIYVQNRQPASLEVLNKIADILDVKFLFISNNKADDLTIKKLIYLNPKMMEKFEGLQ